MLHICQPQLGSSSGFGGNPHPEDPVPSVAVGFQILPSVLKGSNPAIPGEAFPVVFSADAAPVTSSISGEDEMLVVTGVGDPELQIEETGFHPELALAFVFSGGESQSPAPEGAVPTACHGSGAGGRAPTFGVLVVSHKLSWDTTGMSKPGHCSPANMTDKNYKQCNCK